MLRIDLLHVALEERTMKKKLRKVVDRTLIYYVIIGILNFILCTALMFFLFNVCSVSDELSSLINYVLGSVIWYVACKYILFPKRKTTWELIVRFLLEVAICYLVSFHLLAPIISDVLLRFREVWEFVGSIGIEGADMIEGNLQMTLGVVIYAVLNYFGQRYFVFTSRFDIHHRPRKPHD